MLRAALLAGLLLASAPAPAPAQLFLASRPHPQFTVGPLFILANVTPELGDVPVDVLFSLAVPPTLSAGDIEQDLYLLWPGAVAPDPTAGPPDPALARAVEQQGFAVIEEGRLSLSARNLYQRGPDGRSLREPIAGGAPFVTFVREGGGLGISSPATYVRIPWSPKSVNRAYLTGLRLTTRGLVKPKPATWVERTLWGPRHRLTLSFGDVRQRATFPMYFWNRDRVIKLSEDPSQLLINFAHADRLKIDEMFPPAARRQLSETLENTDVVSIFLDRAEGLRPQTLSVQFGYFWGLQSWAPVLIPLLFFVLGNVAAVLVRGLAERLARGVSGRFHIGRGAPAPAGRDTGVVVPRETLARVVPGETRYQEVLRLCGPNPEEQERLTSPGHKTLVYRGRRVVPHRRRALGWLSTVDHWDVEHHEVEIELEGDVVRDVQARVRRTRLPHPETA
jgi:hypothetical protein